MRIYPEQEDSSPLTLAHRFADPNYVLLRRFQAVERACFCSAAASVAPTALGQQLCVLQRKLVAWWTRNYIKLFLKYL